MKLIVLLHGYGANGQDLQSLSVPWAGQGREFIAPNAPDRCAAGFGYEWFSLEGWIPATPFDAFIPRIDSSVMQLKKTLHIELQKRNLSWSDLVLMGFSQGAIMALAVGLSESQPCAGIMAYSGAYLIPKPPLSKPSVLLVHGGADMVVAPDNYTEALKALEGFNVPVTGHIIPTCGHWIDPIGLNTGQRFLESL